MEPRGLILAASRRARRSPPGAVRAFTLIEILVVLTLIGVLIGGALLSLGGVDGEQKSRQDAEQCQAILEYLRDRAELEGREYGLHLDQQGYRVLRFDAPQRRWVAPPDEPLRARRWRAERVPELRVEGRWVRLAPTAAREGEAMRPQLGVDAVGEFTVFALRFAAAPGADPIELAPDAEGRIRLSSETVR